MENDKTKHLANLLEKAQAGDRRCLQQLCKELEKYLRGFFWNKFQSNDIVDDLCQQTYIRFLKNLKSIREPMKLKGFVAKVALHVSQDHLKQQYRRREEGLETYNNKEEESKGLTLDAKDDFIDEGILDKVDLQEALAELPQKSRDILLLKSQGYNYEEIASEKRLTVSGVKMQVKRSLEQLRLILKM